MPDTLELKRQRLIDLRRKAEQGGGEERVAKQHAQGKYTARERVEKLLPRVEQGAQGATGSHVEAMVTAQLTELLGALQRVRQRDADGNASHGRVLAKDSRDNVVHAEGATAVLFGVEGLVVVVRDGVTLVTTVERSLELKTLIESLPDALRDLR